MSIYCSTDAPSDDVCIDYARPLDKEPADGRYAISWDGDADRMFAMKPAPCAPGDDCPECDGWEAPWVYQGSHVMPTLDAERGGWVDLAYPASHCSTPKEHAAGGIDYSEARENGSPAHPWMRFGVNGETVVLHRRQIARIVDTLTRWLTNEFVDDSEYAA